MDAGVDFSRFDSLGRGVVDSVCIIYAGRTEFLEDLWPHNSRFPSEIDGVRTDFYTATSIGDTAADLSIGTFCHESGHLLCRFPDLYDYGTIEREGDDFTSSRHGHLLRHGRRTAWATGSSRPPSASTCAAWSGGRGMSTSLCPARTRPSRASTRR